MQGENTGDGQLKVTYISRYMNLLRIKCAADRDAEIQLQERELRTMLDILGVDAEKLSVVK